jgi:CBS domain-containing protein
MQARDLMTTEVVTVRPDTPVPDIAKALIERNVSAVPVVDADGKLLGIVSEGDLLIREEIGSDRPRSWWLALLSTSEEEARDYVRTHGRRAEHVMTRDVVTIEDSAPLAAIARLLETKRVKRVPVVKDGKLVGIVSRADVLRAFAASAAGAPIAVPQDDRDIRERIHKTLADMGSGAHVNIIVSDGVAHLWGLVDTAEEAQAVRVVAENTPGVKAVEDHLARRPPYAL